MVPERTPCIIAGVAPVCLIGWVYKITLLGKSFWAANYFSGIITSVSPVSSHCSYYVHIFVMENSVQLLIISKIFLLKTRTIFLSCFSDSSVVVVILSHWKLTALHTTHMDLSSFLTKVCILFALIKSTDTWMFSSNLHVYYTSSSCLFSGESNSHVYLYTVGHFLFIYPWMIFLYLFIGALKLGFFISAVLLGHSHAMWNRIDETLLERSLLLQAICLSLFL